HNSQVGHSWMTFNHVGCPVLPSGVSRCRPGSASIASSEGEGMIWQHVRVALLAGGIVAALALTARADDGAPPAPAAPATPAPQYRTVCVNEWVPENYTCTRTVYTKECKQENYTAYRCECVPETRTRTCTTYKMVPEVQTVTRKVCVCV